MCGVHRLLTNTQALSAQISCECLQTDGHGSGKKGASGTHACSLVLKPGKRRKAMRR
jgi:hypothetical protein